MRRIEPSRLAVTGSSFLVSRAQEGTVSWARLTREIVSCERCPRLRAHCLEVARVRRRAFRDQEYWGRPVPGFGDHGAKIVLVGLAPGAHGSNRTGRMFTGDGSGDFLYEALHRVGISSQPEAVSRDDGLELRGAFIAAAARCAPPRNRPTPEELLACRPFLKREIGLLGDARVVVALGAVAWDAVLQVAREAAPGSVPRPRPRFGHGATVRVVVRGGSPAVLLLGSYHPSRQNTQTGRLTMAMLDRVLRHAVAEAWPERAAGRGRGPTKQANRAGGPGARKKETAGP